MERRAAEYMPLKSGNPHRRRRILRTAKLNIVGGAVMLGSCLSAAGLGFAAGRYLALPVAVTAAAGGLLPLVLLSVADRRRWRAMLTAYGGGTADEASAVALELLRRGVVTNVEIQLEHDNRTASLWYRNADVDVVSTVLAERSLPPIDCWF